MSERSVVLSVAMSAAVLEAELAAGRLLCPACDGRLARFGVVTCSGPTVDA